MQQSKGEGRIWKQTGYLLCLLLSKGVVFCIFEINIFSLKVVVNCTPNCPGDLFYHNKLSLFERRITIIDKL